MELNATIFSKPQQDQLKNKIGAELDKLGEKVEDVAQNAMRFVGTWNNKTQYYANDLVFQSTDKAYYIALQDNIGIFPDEITASRYWKKISSVKPTNDPQKVMTNCEIIGTEKSEISPNELKGYLYENPGAIFNAQNLDGRSDLILYQSQAEPGKLCTTTILDGASVVIYEISVDEASNAWVAKKCTITSNGASIANITAPAQIIPHVAQLDKTFHNYY